ncbi:MAG TPA: fused response regulator/phosphatase [Leptospiraceae bacterium]|nr:fused response regulator/phosphatase [Leptospiraceae bacterium]HNE23609.1 fused response regulator/phosphatase [Leptospiraceae bacterium]
MEKKPLLLIVDDDPNIRAILQNILAENHNLLHANDGIEGLGVARKSLPDLIISDVMMPGMDGFEFCASIRSDPFLRRIPILLLTGEHDLGSKLKGLHQRADDYVTKPFHAEEIEARVSNLLEKRRLERELQQRLEEMQNDLALARNVQQQLLPVRIPPLPNAHFETLYRPIAALGGDFFEFVVLPDRLGLFICDVAGHGIPAALVASMVKIVLANVAMDAAGPGDLMVRLNRQMIQSTGERYVTAFYATLDLSTLQMQFASAGHIAPILVRNGALIPLEAHGPLLGAFPKDHWGEEVVALQPRDRVFFYTDGVIDCRNKSEEHFGEERLNSCLLAHQGATARFFLDQLYHEISHFVGDRNFADDITAFVIDLATRKGAVVS